ncbi:MAG: hypothetical protein QMD21_05390, partial [Candidatus Thermoplasmatota archaeon]|nr:hypothetical protein [Candidatus Thermoplasmatota archaeon]
FSLFPFSLSFPEEFLSLFRKEKERLLLKRKKKGFFRTPEVQSTTRCFSAFVLAMGVNNRIFKELLRNPLLLFFFRQSLFLLFTREGKGLSQIWRLSPLSYLRIWKTTPFSFL